MASSKYTAQDVYDEVYCSNWEEVERIILAEPQIITQRYNNITPLRHIVYFCPSEEFILKILQFGTTKDVEELDGEGQFSTILHPLSVRGYSKALAYVLNITSKRVNSPDEDGNTPLHWLLRSNLQFSSHKEAARILLEFKADVHMNNKDGLTPMDKYSMNECRKYDIVKKGKQREEIWQMLNSYAIPGVVLARGKEAIKVFKEELESGQITVNHGRLMITGKEGVGKTCLVNTLLEKPFNDEEPSTDGIVLTTAFYTDDNNYLKWKENVKIDESQRTKEMYENALEANVADKLKVKSLSNNTKLPIQETESELSIPVLSKEYVNLKEDNMKSKIIQSAKQTVNEEPTTTSTIGLHQSASNFSEENTLTFKQKQEKVDGYIQNEWKVDKSNQTLSTEMQKRIINRIKENKAKVFGNEDTTYIWDFAGQQLYYITHRIFLTSEAVYLILFNLTEGMHDKGKVRIHGKCRVSRMAKQDMTCNMTNVQIIKYWMKLIYTYAIPSDSQKQNQQVRKPQIAVVGTHCQSIPGTEKEKKRWIKENFEILFEEIENTPYEFHVIRKQYAIDNKFPSESEMLQVLKEDVSRHLKALPKTIPLKWLELQRQLQEISKTEVRMTYREVCKIASECGISTGNLIHTLHYLHDIGMVLYFENNELLKKTVIVNPRKLIDIFRKIITYVEPTDELPRMVKLWRKLENEGILEEELARNVWEDQLRKDEHNFEVFIEIMKQFGLLCEKIKNEDKAHRSFFVPCRLKHVEESMTMDRDTDQMVSFYIASDDFLPDSIFHLLIVSLLGMAQDKGYTASPKLFSNKATIGLGLHHHLSLGYIIVDNKSSIKFEISRVSEVKEDGCEISTGEPSPNICMEILDFLKQELKVLTSTMKRTGYEFRVLCWRNTGKETHFHSLEECLLNNSIRCDDRLLSTSKLQRLFMNKTDADNNPSNKQPVPSEGCYLDDRLLFSIADNVGVDWKGLGIKLGLSWNKLEQLHCDEKRILDCTMKMLTEWRKGQRCGTNQAEIMRVALKEQGLIHIADQYFPSE